MKFDLFYELSVPGFGKRTEAQVFHDTLRELETAEHCGFNTAWFVEHHFMPEYSHSSAPDLLLAAASQRTQRLRLGYGIIPLPYHHPVQVAERIATLDILCNGRVEFGFGRGFSPREYECFAANMAQSRHITSEALQIILQSFASRPVTYSGQHFQLDNINVIPKPLQQPHPPLWSAAVSPESFSQAAQLGVGVLAGPFKPWFMIRQDIKRYQQAWKKYKASNLTDGTEARPQVGMTIGIFCLEDGQQARELAKEGMEWFYRALLQQTRPVLESLYSSYEHYRHLGRYRFLLDKIVRLSLLERLGMVIVGDPQHCIKQLSKLQSAGVTRVLCAIGAGVLDTQQVEASMRVMSRQVMPAFIEQSSQSTDAERAHEEPA
jgi:alkanesulfonate monooxygenase SsuD/methylene tetrahydromethanopterin reductase-like flavin-dependent oxidoreductase (luciferase family)